MFFFKIIVICVLALFPVQSFSQPITTHSTKGKVVPNFQNNSIDIYNPGGRQNVPLAGISVDPRKAAAAQKYIEDKYRAQQSSSVRMYTDQYGNSRVMLNGQDLNRELVRRGWAVPNSICATNPGAPNCNGLR